MNAHEPGRHWTEFDWNGRVARAWSPPPLSSRAFSLGEPAIRATERALAALRSMDQRVMAGAEPIGRLMLRSEGIASSAIEGLAVRLEELVAVEVLGSGAAAASWVAGNLAAVSEALAAAGPLAADDMHSWHRLLMENSNRPASLHGTWRSSPGWIGGTSPLDAAYVPPLPDEIPDLVADLVSYVNDSPADPVTRAAVAHAQFEAIHPYGDGNGRIGRVLVGWILRRSGAVASYPPPVSVSILRDPGGYLSGLYEFREGDPNRWIEWFADRIAQSATATGELHADVDDLLGGWAELLAAVRSDSSAHCAARLLPTFPLISAAQVATKCGVSARGAANGLETLASLGIVSAFEPADRPRGRPTKWWIADELVTTVQRWIG